MAARPGSKACVGTPGVDQAQGGGVQCCWLPTPAPHTHWTSVPAHICRTQCAHVQGQRKGARACQPTARLVLSSAAGPREARGKTAEALALLDAPAGRRVLYSGGAVKDAPPAACGTCAPAHTSHCMPPTYPAVGAGQRRRAVFCELGAALGQPACFEPGWGRVGSSSSNSRGGSRTDSGKLPARTCQPSAGVPQHRAASLQGLPRRRAAARAARRRLHGQRRVQQPPRGKPHNRQHRRGAWCQGDAARLLGGAAGHGLCLPSVHHQLPAHFQAAPAGRKRCPNSEGRRLAPPPLG